MKWELIDVENRVKHNSKTAERLQAKQVEEEGTRTVDQTNKY